MRNIASDLAIEIDGYIELLNLKRTETADFKIEIAKKILMEVMNYRRIAKSSETCDGFNCPKCVSLYLPKILHAVKLNEPVTFVLPAFPGKSPNPNKVLGPLPDYAEQLSLRFLGNLCNQIKKYYLPGMKIVLCSDGRVFSDIIGMREENVTAYQVELQKLINEMSLTDLTTFNLDDFYEKASFDQMREKLMRDYGKTLESLKYKVKNGAQPTSTPEEQEANRMFCGITRFLFEDSIYPGQTKARSVIQKESRLKAYEVIRRSNAWSELIAEHFPSAVRLSIHPQTCGSKKLGICLIGNDSWMTPWHGVLVEKKGGHVLMKRFEAEALGAELIFSPAGRPSHYKMKGI